jgi:hypothetical protein
MDTKRVLPSILLLLGALILFPNIVPAHAQTTGTVCIIPSSSSSCPSSPATVLGTAGVQLRVSVFIQGSEGINGFDVTLLADHTILKPAGADLTGTVLIAPQTVILECLGGVLVQGSFCSSTDTADTLHFVVSGALGQLTTPPTTGLLFTAIYNVTADSSGIPLGYQTGCSSSSVSGTTTCVTITNGGLMPVPENVQTAVFTTQDFSITANPATITLSRGAQGTSTITLTSLSGFAGTINLSSSILPSRAHSPTSTLSATSVTLNSGGTTPVTITVSTNKNTSTGSYTITVTGTSGPRTHSVSIAVTVTH